MERQKELNKKKTNWLKRGGDLSVIFVPATPGSEIRAEEKIREVHKRKRERGVGIKVLEKSDRATKSMVQN